MRKAGGNSRTGSQPSHLLGTRMSTPILLDRKKGKKNLKRPSKVATEIGVSRKRKTNDGHGLLRAAQGMEKKKHIPGEEEKSGGIPLKGGFHHPK